MTKEIIELKELNAAYEAALEFDRCPDSTKYEKISYMFEMNLSEKYVKKALKENQGRRPDEIALLICEKIKALPL